jgi:F-type H+-transporting ATPase subunit b
MEKRRRRIRAMAVVALSAMLLLAGEALAAEGDLQLMPAFKMLTALLVLFVILIFPVNALLFRPIFRVLDARDEKIAGTRRSAEQLAAQAEEVLALYERSLRQVRDGAEQERKERLVGARGESMERTAAARTEAEREIERAREQIVAGLEEARAALRPQAEQLAREVSARVLGRTLS